MIGEPLLKMVESPILVEAARRILGAEDVARRRLRHRRRLPGAAAIRQVYWHVDGGPDVRQVSFRTALDRHDASNAPLRVLPGSHHRSRDEVAAELMQLELATGNHEEPPEHCYARHPEEVEVVLDPRWTLIWTPSCWHATGLKTGVGPAAGHGLELLPAGGPQARREGGDAAVPRMAGLARGAPAPLGPRLLSVSPAPAPPPPSTRPRCGASSRPCATTSGSRTAACRSPRSRWPASTCASWRSCSPAAPCTSSTPRRSNPRRRRTMERLARYFDADADELAVMRGVSEAFHTVLRGLPWQAGDRIVISDNEEAAPACCPACTCGTASASRW